MTQLRRILCFAVFGAALLFLPGKAADAALGQQESPLTILRDAQRPHERSPTIFPRLARDVKGERNLSSVGDMRLLRQGVAFCRA